MRRGALLCLLAVVLSAGGCTRPTPPAAHPRRPSIAGERIPLGKLPPTVIPTRYRIALTVNPTADRFSGHVEIDVRFSEKRRAIFLHGRGLNVLAASVRLNAKHSIPAHYAQADKSGVARLIFVDEVPAGKATLVFDYDAPFGNALSGLYKVVDKGEAYAFTQFESISARQAFPSFDEPGFKTPFQLSVTAPSGDKVVSNMPLQSISHQRGGLMTSLFQWTRPLPTYLLMLAVGPLDVVDAGEIPPNAYRNRPIRIRGIAAHGEGRRLAYALSLTPKVVQALENYFALAFPFPKLDLVAVPNFAASATENAGSITFRERLLLVDTNAPLDQKRSTLAIQAHEISHQWFGDLVTPAWWDDIWLNESFANWMEYKVAQAVRPEQEFDTNSLRNGFDAMDVDELPSARAVRQPVRNADDIANVFDAITYGKGSAVLSMFESFLGEEGFRAAVHAYLVRYANRNATTDNFIDVVATTARTPNQEKVAITIDKNGVITWNGHPVPSMAGLIDQESHMAASASSQQVGGAFHDFLNQPGIPYLRFEVACAGAPLARLVQSAYTPIGTEPRRSSWRIPVCLKDEGGGDRFCRIADRKVSEVLMGATCPSALMPNDQGKGYYRFNLGAVGWHVLIERAPKLTPADQITLLNNLAVAIHAGDAAPADLLLAMHLLAPSARWDVLWTINDLLRRLRIQSLSAADISPYRAFVSLNFAKRFQELGIRSGGTEDTATTLARQWLAALMVSEAHDAPATAELAAAANAFLSGNPSAGPAPEILAEALRAGILTGGADFAKKLLAALESTDSENLRRQIIYAYAGSEDPAVIQNLLSYALTTRMRAGELRYLYEYMSQEQIAQRALWNWYKANYEALLARVSRDGMRGAPAILAQACDASSRDELEAFFRPKVGQLTGIDRALALSEESIARCVAFRQVGAQSVEAAFRSSPR